MEFASCGAQLHNPPWLLEPGAVGYSLCDLNAPFYVAGLQLLQPCWWVGQPSAFCQQGLGEMTVGHS